MHLVEKITTQKQVRVKKIFYSVRTIIIWMAILYPIISFIDFFLVKQASLFKIVEQREAEHITGPRNSLIGAIGTLLSGAPPVLMAILRVKKFKKNQINQILFFFIGLGFFSMFLSGGRNAFFISIIFLFLYKHFFFQEEKKDQKKWSLNKVFAYIFVSCCIFFSMKMFSMRFEAQGFDIGFMLEYLEHEYLVSVYKPEFKDETIIILYSILIYLLHYVCHALTYLNDYFVLSYSPYLSGAYNFPTIVRFIDLIIGSDLFSASRERMLLTGVYLTLPGSLYLDFGIIGTLVICLLLGATYGHLSYKIKTLLLYQKILLTYLTTAFIFSPIYSVFGMGNGLSLLFIIIIIMFYSIKIRY